MCEWFHRDAYTNSGSGMGVPTTGTSKKQYMFTKDRSTRESRHSQEAWLQNPCCFTLRTGWDTTPEREIGRSQDLDLETISTTWVITAYPGENPGTLHSNKGWYRQVTELCLTLCNPWTICRLPGSFVHGILQARIRGVGICFLLQGIFPTQGSNPGLMHCRQILFIWANQTKTQAVNASSLQNGNLRMCVCVCVRARLVAQSCPTLCDPHGL